jgi:hypothetical protein
MLRYIHALALASVLAFGMTQEAPAGGCAGAGCGCAPAVVLAPPCPPLVQSYLVNQGPALSGPGHYLGQIEDGGPCCYPYVGYVYSGYPYGVFGPGGYARGFYNPYLGYPYADGPFVRYRHGARHPAWPAYRRAYPLVR